MRDTFLDSQSFIYSVERICSSKNIQKYSSELLSRISPSEDVTNRFINRLVIKRKNLNSLIALSILSWYIPQEIGVLLRLELEEQFELRNSFWKILLQNKGLCLSVLLETKQWHTRDFFGNILKEEILLSYYEKVFAHLEKIKPKVKRVTRHRGYRDKGSLRNIHEIHELVDYSQRMNRIEDKRKIYQDYLLLMEGFYS